MADRFIRTRMLLGDAAMERLANAKVAVFGIGGVGGYVVEGLVRSGVGALELIDSDEVEFSNLNRQIIATEDTIGQLKVDVAEKRAHSINPDCSIRARRMFFLPETADQFDFRDYDYVVDAIDTVSGKIGLAEAAYEAGTPIISAMGAGNKLDPTAFEVADINKTSVCPLARVMRRELKKRGIPSLKVVYSKESPVETQPVFAAPDSGDEKKAPEVLVRPGSGRPVPGSLAFVPSVMGLIIAGEVVRDLTGITSRDYDI